MTPGSLLINPMREKPQALQLCKKKHRQVLLYPLVH